MLVQLEDFLGFEIRYGKISPSLLRYIEVRDLSLASPSGEETLFLKRIRIHYRLSKIFTGSPEEAVSRISLVNSRVVIDPDRENELKLLLQKITTRQAYEAASTGETEPLPFNVSFSGKNLSISYRSSQGVFEARRIFFTVTPETESYSVDLRGSLQGEGMSFPHFSEASGEVRIQGRVGRALDWGETIIHTKGVRSSLVDYPRLTVQLQYRNNELVLRKVQDRLPFDLSLLFRPETGGLDFNFSAEGFIPARQFILKPAFDQWIFLSSAELSGTIDGSFYPARGEVRYRSSLQVLLPSNPWVDLPLQGSLTMEGQNTKLQIERLDLRTPRGNLFFSGTTDLADPIPFPRGNLQISRWAVPGGPLSSLVYLSRGPQGDYRLHAPYASYGGLDFENISLGIEGDLSGFEYSLAGSLTDEEGENVVAIQGDYHAGEERFIQGEIEARDFPLGRVVSILTRRTLPKELEGLVLNSRAFVSSDFERYSFLTQGFKITRRDAADDFLTASLSGNDSSLTIRQLSGRYGDFEASLTGGAFYPPGSPVTWNSRIETSGAVFHIQGSYFQDEFLHFQGDHGLDAMVVFLQDRLDFQVSLEEFPLTFREDELLLTLSSQGFWSTSGAWLVRADKAQLVGLSSLWGRQTDDILTFTGVVSPDFLRLMSIGYADGETSLKGNSEIRYDLNNRTAGGWLQMSDPGGTETLQLAAEFQDGMLDGGMAVQGFPLGRIGFEALTGRLNGEVRFDGAFSSPDLSIVIEVVNGEFNETPVSLSGAITLEEDILNVLNLQASYLNHSLEVERVRFNLSGGMVTGNGRIEGAWQDDPYSARIGLDLTTGPMKERQEILSFFRHDFDGQVRLENIKMSGQDYPSWKLAVNQSEEILFLSGGPQDALDMQFGRDGRFSLTVLETLPFSFQSTGTLSKGVIDADFWNIKLKVEALSRLFTLPFMKFLEGRAEGGLHLSGMINDPDIEGSLFLTDMVLKVNVVNDLITFTDARIRADQKVLSMEDIVVSTKGGQALFHGEFTLDHLLPYNYDLQITTFTNRDLHLGLDIAAFGIEGSVKGSINIFGTMDEHKLTGELDVYSGILTLDTRELMAGLSSKYDFAVDLVFNLKQNNQFYWPSRNFPILKAYAEGGQSLILKQNSARKELVVQGDVAVKGGEIFYFRRNFYLQEGIISFNETGYRFDPVLNTRAVLREVDDQGELVRIYLVAENMRFSQFNPRFESDPYRLETEILAMLGANLFESGGNENLLGDAILLTSDVVSQFGFVQGLQDSLREILNLDLFSLRTQIVPNLLMDRFFANSNETALGAGNLSRYLDNTTLFLGKYFGNDFFLQAMIQMDYYGNQYDEYYPVPVFNIDTEIALEWKSPLALIQLSLYPQFFREDEPWLTSSLGLSWSFSY